MSHGPPLRPALIVADGRLDDAQLVRMAATPGCLVIGADGGAGRALQAGVHVHLVVGDLDSLDAGDLERLRADGSVIERARPDKDESDTELALLTAIERDAAPVVILGALGGTRLDHELANLLLLFVGCFLEPTAAITLLVPILAPICMKLGIDMVHFGLVMVLNLMIGLLHPPMGTVLFVLSRVAKLSFERTTIAILPWLVPLLLTLGLCTYVPQIVLWLPRQFF